MGTKVKGVSSIQAADKEDHKPPVSIKEREFKHSFFALCGENLPQTIARQFSYLSWVIGRALPLPVRGVPFQERIK